MSGVVEFEGILQAVWVDGSSGIRSANGGGSSLVFSLAQGSSLWFSLARVWWMDEEEDGSVLFKGAHLIGNWQRHGSSGQLAGEWRQCGWLAGHGSEWRRPAGRWLCEAGSAAQWSVARGGVCGGEAGCE